MSGHLEIPRICCFYLLPWRGKSNYPLQYRPNARLSGSRKLSVEYVVTQRLSLDQLIGIYSSIPRVTVPYSLAPLMEKSLIFSNLGLRLWTQELIANSSLLRQCKQNTGRKVSQGFVLLVWAKLTVHQFFEETVQLLLATAGAFMVARMLSHVWILSPTSVWWL